MGGLLGESVYYKTLNQFFENKISITQLRELINKLVENKQLDKFFSKLHQERFCYIEQNIISLNEQVDKLTSDCNSNERKQRLLVMLGFREREADNLLKKGSLINYFHNSGNGNSRQNLDFRELVMISSFLETFPYYLIGSTSLDNEHPWFKYCNYIDNNIFKNNKDYYIFGKIILKEVDVGISIIKSKSFTQISLCSHENQELNNIYWLDYLLNLSKLIGLNYVREKYIFSSASIFFQPKTRIYRLTYWSNRSEKEKTMHYLRIFSSRTEEVIIGDTIVKRPIENINKIILGLYSNKFI